MENKVKPSFQLYRNKCLILKKKIFVQVCGKKLTSWLHISKIVLLEETAIKQFFFVEKTNFSTFKHTRVVNFKKINSVEFGLKSKILKSVFF